MSERSGTTKWDEDLDGRDSLMATLTALRDRLREQHLHGADALDAAIERLAAIGEERRAHWTDDLIEAVSDAMEDNAYHDEKAYESTWNAPWTVTHED